MINLVLKKFSISLQENLKICIYFPLNDIFIFFNFSIFQFSLEHLLARLLYFCSYLLVN